mmetsp:Transcript_23000/g.39275  ORF Transcript_23000/g.39275 Transcript_23000/m.39275 type:complete len:195 (+) Transcript_23000:1-585(+)
MFVTFGVMNLIIAVFVENTIACAHQFAAQRQFGARSDATTKARKLVKLMVKLLKAKREIPSTPSSSTNVDPDDFQNLDHYSLRITQDQFEEILYSDPKVLSILEDLDISHISQEQLFDILDADGNGYLAISELVDGIMKLRGPADKGDGVATVLMLRQLQKQVSKFEEHTQHRFKILGGLCNQNRSPRPELSVI